MILLPFFLFWARNPMHFGPRLRFASRTGIFLVSFAAPVFCSDIAAQVSGPNGSGDSTSSSSPPTTPAPAAKGHPQQEPRQIREGTVFQNVKGRFTMVGSRWVFIPLRDDAANGLAATDLAGKTVGEKRTSAIVFETRNKSGREISITTSTQQTRLKSVKEYAPDNVPLAADDLPQLVVTENLMLQRVVESIRSDANESSGATWIISGEIKEFFDDNLLMLRSAQRAVAMSP